MHSILVEALRGGLGPADLTFEPIDDAVGLLRHGPSGVSLRVRLVHGVAEALDREAETGAEPLLVFAPVIFADEAVRLRDRGMNYLDAVGNLLVRGPGLHLEIQRPETGKRLRRHQGGFGMTPKKAQVVFAVLVWADALRVSRQRLAEWAGVSVGIAHNTLTELRDTGYLTPGRTPTLMDRERLLDLWVSAYPGGLGASLELASFSGGAPSRERVAEHGLLLGGEAATPLVRSPETITLYGEAVPPLLVAQQRWGSAQPHTVFLRRRFWESGAQEHERGRVPDLLVCADLLASADSRLREVGEAMRAQL